MKTVPGNLWLGCRVLWTCRLWQRLPKQGIVVRVCSDVPVPLPPHWGSFSSTFLISYSPSLIFFLFLVQKVPCALSPPCSGTKQFPLTGMHLRPYKPFKVFSVLQNPAAVQSDPGDPIKYSYSTLFSCYSTCKAGRPYHSYLCELPPSLGCEGCWHGTLPSYTSQDSRTHSRSFECLSCAQRGPGSWGNSEKPRPLRPRPPP